jgi:hypothetical protein
MGLTGLLLFPLSLVCFSLTLFIAVCGRGSNTGTALALLVPIPTVFGFLGFLWGIFSSLSVIAASNVSLNPADVVMGLSESLVTPMLGLLLTLPSYLAAITVLFLRSLRASPCRV